MFKEQRLCDLVLETEDGEVVCAHRAILATRSPVYFCIALPAYFCKTIKISLILLTCTTLKVFSAMFGHGMKEDNETKVPIREMDMLVLKEMLFYIYTGEVIRLLAHLFSRFQFSYIILLCTKF